MDARISPLDLPVEVVIVILNHLPMAEAVRSSILSRSWRHQWRSIRDFSFNFDDGLDIAAVDHVLGLHSAPIQSFSLSDSRCRFYSRDLDRWLAALYADPLPLRSLDLDLRPSFTFDPRFSFSNLNHLRLCGCSLPSYSFDRVGFPVLETLHLSGCIRPDYDSSRINDLIIDFPHLQKLTLLDMECMALSICAPKLRSFVFKGGLRGFALDSAPLLTTVVINLHEFHEDVKIKELSECSLFKALVDARSIEKLNLLDNSLCFLGNFRIPDWIPDSFERLKVLTLTVDFSNQWEILVLLCLLRSAPNLHEIKIEGLKYKQETWGLDYEFWQDQNYLELPELRTLKLTHTDCDEPMLEGDEPIWDFIRYILPKTRELKKMEINICPSTRYRGNVGKLSDSNELILFCRAYTRAQIVVTGEFLSKCTITSLGSDDALSVWKEFDEHKQIKELQEALQSQSQKYEEMMQIQQQQQQQEIMQIQQQTIEMMQSQFASQQ